MACQIKRQMSNLCLAKFTMHMRMSQLLYCSCLTRCPTVISYRVPSLISSHVPSCACFAIFSENGLALPLPTVLCSIFIPDHVPPLIASHSFVPFSSHFPSATPHSLCPISCPIPRPVPWLSCSYFTQNIFQRHVALRSIHPVSHLRSAFNPGKCGS